MCAERIFKQLQWLVLMLIKLHFLNENQKQEKERGDRISKYVTTLGSGTQHKWRDTCIIPLLIFEV
jgi:hypothetical protein